MDSKQKVVIALSGGVDSSVSALILLEKDYEVVAVTAKMLDDEKFEKVAQDAKKVADKLGIEHKVLDLTKEFREKVISYFESSYECGSTPNPCVICNKHIKWGAIFDYAIDELGADYVATGHYARLVNEDERFLLYPPQDRKKDQLYFLFELSQEQLSKTLFPLSKLLKEQVRTIAVENDLPSKSQKESQDICFIKKPMSAKDYIQEHVSSKPGDFIHCSSGQKLGTHDGFSQYTVGQRKGIGISYSEPLYVVKIDPETAIVYLGSEDDVMKTSVLLENVNWHDDRKSMPFEALVKIRYNMQPRKALIVDEGEFVKALFYEPVYAPAKGQAAVFYDFKDGHLLGGGWIK